MTIVGKISKSKNIILIPIIIFTVYLTHTMRNINLEQKISEAKRLVKRAPKVYDLNIQQYQPFKHLKQLQHKHISNLHQQNLNSSTAIAFKQPHASQQYSQSLPSRLAPPIIIQLFSKLRNHYQSYSGVTKDSIPYERRKLRISLYNLFIFHYDSLTHFLRASPQVIMVPKNIITWMNW